MGYYLEPKAVTKEEFLSDFGTEITRDQFASAAIVPETTLVALVHNPSFSAALLVYNEYERSRVLNDSSHRPYQLFTIPTNELATSDAVPESVINMILGLTPEGKEESKGEAFLREMRKLAYR